MTPFPLHRSAVAAAYAASPAWAPPMWRPGQAPARVPTGAAFWATSAARSGCRCCQQPTGPGGPLHWPLLMRSCAPLLRLHREHICAFDLQQHINKKCDTPLDAVFHNSQRQRRNKNP